jgi:hypothetical protein
MVGRRNIGGEFGVAIAVEAGKDVRRRVAALLSWPD